MKQSAIVQYQYSSVIFMYLNEIVDEKFQRSNAMWNNSFVRINKTDKTFRTCKKTADEGVYDENSQQKPTRD